MLVREVVPVEVIVYEVRILVLRSGSCLEELRIAAQKRGR